jgi:hypothetical protein
MFKEHKNRFQGRYDKKGLSYRPAKLHRLAESIPGILKRFQIRALNSELMIRSWELHSHIQCTLFVQSSFEYHIQLVLWIKLNDVRNHIKVNNPSPPRPQSSYRQS